jgi:hypothetical protein
MQSEHVIGAHPVEGNAAQPGAVPSDQTGVVASPPIAESGHEEAHVHLAPQSVWPITLAAGITIASAGLVTTGLVSLVGIIVSIAAIYYWVQELRHEPH